MRLLHTILYMVCLVKGCLAQQPDSVFRSPLSWVRREITLLTGYQQGRYGFAELGIGHNTYGSVHHPFDIGYYAGAELRVDRPELWGVKAGLYVDGGFAMGVQYIHYMEGAQTMEVLRPEYGIGILKAKLTYAYNLRLTKPHLEGLNTHMISLSYAFRLKRARNVDPYQRDP